VATSKVSRVRIIRKTIMVGGWLGGFRLTRRGTLDRAVLIHAKSGDGTDHPPDGSEIWIRDV
jgi:hypothetical protein